MSQAQANSMLLERVEQLDEIHQEALLAAAHALYRGAGLEEAVTAGNAVLASYGRPPIDPASVREEGEDQ